jgi:Zn-dependent protease with chaperone function
MISVVIVTLPVVLAAVFAGLAPPMARRLPPAAGAWLLSVGGLVISAASIAILGFLAFSWAGQFALLATHGRWSGTALQHDDPVPAVIEIAALIMLVWVTARVTRRLVRCARSVVEACRLAAALPAPGGELAVVQDTALIAYAVPGRPGRLVASTGLLRSLTPEQRRAVLAHERSHLVHRHYLHHIAAQLAAAANPLLRRLPDAVTFATERWADEDAARTVTRAAVADAVARVAHGQRTPAAPPRLVLAVAAEHVAGRIRALRAAPPRVCWHLAVPLLVLALAAASVLLAAHDTERLFEAAKYAYQLTHYQP